MARITVNYMPYHTDVGFLRIKQQYIDIDHWRIAFFIHVYASMWVLLAGFTQFSSRLQRASPKWHRLLGYVYVVNILLVTGPAGLLMGFYANGGFSSRLGFVLLAALWIYFTFRAWRCSRTGDYAAHRRHMIRSYALTLSAITLRIWKYVLTNLYHLDPSWVFPPMDVYRAVAWAGWGVNLLVAEWMIRRRTH